MKIKLFLVSLLSFLLFFNACQPTEKVTIGLLMDDFIQERWQKDKDIFIAHAEANSAIVMVEAAKGDDKLQIEQAGKLIAAGIDILVVVPVNHETSAKIVELAHNANIKVIAYDRLILNANLDYYISFDNIGVGKLQAEYISRAKPQGKYVLIGGASTDNNSYLLHEGQMNTLKPKIESGDIEIIFDQYVDVWTEDDGYRLMKECLEQCDTIDAVLAGNDALAAGVIRALQEKNLAGQVLVAGQDADLAASKRIHQGTQSMTVFKDIRKLAETIADVSVKLAKGDEVIQFTHKMDNNKVEVPSVLLSPTVMNIDNLQQ